MSINKNQLFSLASALALMNLSLLGGCGDQPTPLAQSSTQSSTPAEDDRAWLTRWGENSMGPWTTDQLLADCARGRHSAQTLAWNPVLDAWKPLGELFPSASFNGSVEDGRRWTLLLDRMNDSVDEDQSDAFWSELYKATGEDSATPFVPTRERGARLQQWRSRTRPMVEQALKLRGRFGPEDVLDGGGVNGTSSLRHALILEASDAIARGDDEAVLQALECLATIGRQMNLGLFGLYSQQSREIERQIGEDPMSWQEHEEIQLRQSLATLANINGILSIWSDWRSVPGATERLAAQLEWVDLDELERFQQTHGTKGARNAVPGYTVEDRARRHQARMALIKELRS